MRVDLPGFGDVKSSMEAVPANKYLVVIAKGEDKLTKDGQSKIIAWDFEITEGEFKGRHVFTNTSLKPEALWNLKSLLEACGAEFDEGGFDTEAVVGCQLQVNVVQEEYEGRPRNRVTAYYPA